MKTSALTIVVLLMLMIVVVRAGGPLDGSVSEAYLSTRHAVIGVGADTTIDLVANVSNLREWEVEWQWPQSVREQHVGFGVPSQPRIKFHWIHRGDGRITTEQAVEPALSGNVLLGSLTVRVDQPGPMVIKSRLSTEQHEYQLEHHLLVVQCVADYTDSGSRGLLDVSKLADFYGCSIGDECYSPLYDLYGNGKVDMTDILIAAGYWGIPCPGVEE